MYVVINQCAKRVRVGGFGCLVVVVFFFLALVFFLYVDCWDCWIMPQNRILGFQFLYALSCFVFMYNRLFFVVCIILIEYRVSVQYF